MMLAEIKFSTAENNKVNKILHEYADGMEGSHKHWETNRRASKPREDSLTGKKGEFFVAKYILDNYGYKLQPDVEIYAKNKKNWDADLPYSTVSDTMPDIHVKTCSNKTIEYAKTESWTFQAANGNGFFGTDKLLKSAEFDKDLIALIHVPTWESDYAILHHLITWETAKKFLADPISPRLKGIKLCLYTKDLESSRKVKNYV
jgi:hypothetical protein